MLQRSGYEVLWTDRSHMIATRTETAPKGAESLGIASDQA
jgi:hypothetical protein